VLGRSKAFGLRGRKGEEWVSWAKSQEREEGKGSFLFLFISKLISKRICIPFQI